MKKTTYSIRLTFMLVVSSCASVWAAGTAIPFQDSFETYNAGLITASPWSLTNEGVANVQQSDVLSGAGTKACSLTNGTLTLAVDQASGNYSNVWCRLYLKATGYDDRGGPPVVSNGTSVACYLTTNGILKAYASYGTSNGWTNVTGVGGVSTGAWVGLAFHIDYISEKYDIYADTAGTYGATLTKKNDVPITFNTNNVEVEMRDLQVKNQAVLDGIVLAGSTREVAASSPEFVKLQSNTSSENVPKGIIGNYTDPQNKLSGALGADLKTGLQNGDKVRFFYTNGWNTYTLIGGEWAIAGGDSGMAIDSFSIPAGLGMWVRRAATGNTLTFYAFDDLPANVTKTLYGSDHAGMAGWNLLAWPFTASRAANASGNWGFLASADWGDRAYLFQNGSFVPLWWDDGNSKWKRSNNTDSTDVLAAGTSFWFYRAAVGPANWVVNNPE